MFFKFSLFIFMLALCILYLKNTETFYLICDKVTKDPSNSKNSIEMILDKENSTGMNINEKLLWKKLKFVNLCNEFHSDYSTHKLMKNTLHILHNFVYSFNTESFSELDEESIKDYIQKMDLNSFKFTIYATKFIHIFMYSIIIYVLIVSIPHILAQLVLFFVNRILYTIFFILLVEAILKICFQVDTDIVTIIFGNERVDLLSIPYIKQIIESLSHPLKLLKAII
jgi:hypothetical protein